MYQALNRRNAVKLAAVTSVSYFIAFVPLAILLFNDSLGFSIIVGVLIATIATGFVMFANILIGKYYTKKFDL
ncbi:MAG: hypothetical protein ACYCSO_00340 [Cuniculiplasma sp.]